MNGEYISNEINNIEINPIYELKNSGGDNLTMYILEDEYPIFIELIDGVGGNFNYGDPDKISVSLSSDLINLINSLNCEWYYDWDGDGYWDEDGRILYVQYQFSISAVFKSIDDLNAAKTILSIIR